MDKADVARRVLGYVRSRYEDDGSPITDEEIMDALKIDEVDLAQARLTLEEQGLVTTKIIEK